MDAVARPMMEDQSCKERTLATAIEGLGHRLELCEKMGATLQLGFESGEQVEKTTLRAVEKKAEVVPPTLDYVESTIAVLELYDVRLSELHSRLDRVAQYVSQLALPKVQ